VNQKASSSDQLFVRDIAATVVAQWLETADFPDRLLPDVMPDRALGMELVFGVVRQRRMLEWTMNLYVHHKPEPLVRACLFLGIYQLLCMDFVPDYAAVNETVATVKRLAGAAQVRFVNGVLRRLVREREAWQAAFARAPLGVRESHPDFLIQRWRRQFGDVRTAAICRWDNQRPEVVIRPNQIKMSMNLFQGQLKQAGIEAVPHPAAPAECLTLPHGVTVEQVPGYAEGWFTVQDPATLAAIRLLDVQPGLCVLDACAAPGGKTLLMAEKMAGEGELVAMDCHEDRLALLRENVARMAWPNIRVVQGDAAQAENPALGQQLFDRILLDVPCTNTGVLRRRPDARWRFSDVRLAQQVETQRTILDAMSARLKLSGRLVYSTCSLEQEEDTKQIEAWLKGHPDFVLIEESLLVPPESHTDGAYAAAIERRT
jgi:16S rRNA (cytosine967-C5)-methyltransferase